MDKPYYVVGIDPAFGGTGLALFKEGILTSVALFKKKGKQPFEDRANFIAANVREWLREELYKTDCPSFTKVGTPLIMCEIPSYQATPSRSMGWKKGDLQKLTYLVGVIGYACTYAWHKHRYQDKTPEPCYRTVTPAGWKGQLSKEIVINRIKKRLPNVVENFNPKLDIWDAIGIGLWTLDEF
tara:strand:+ start:12544 stop:13092 length:549 start_codon:yes stop_codon:yes gene_type:complete